MWSHRSLSVAPKTVNQKRYVDSIRSRTVTFGVGPAGTGKTFLAVAMAAAALSRHEVNRIILTRPAVEAGERLGLPAGRSDGEGGPLPAPAVRRAARHARSGEGLPASRAWRDRDRAARVHAWSHAQRLVRDPRRGSEHDARADEDVPDAARLWFEVVVTGDITQVDLPREQRSGLSWWGRCWMRSRASSSCASAARTWCATSSCSGSWRHTTSTAGARPTRLGDMRLPRVRCSARSGPGAVARRRCRGAGRGSAFGRASSLSRSHRCSKSRSSARNCSQGRFLSGG